jgi:hypothetical protein
MRAKPCSTSPAAGQPTERALPELTLAELSVELAAKRPSSSEIVDTLLGRIPKLKSHFAIVQSQLVFAILS